MVIESATHAQEHTFAPGTVVRNRGRLWRVDGQEEDVLIATALDTGEPEQPKFYIPFEDIQFRSDRAVGEDRAPHEYPLYNLFRMDLGTGEIVQLTDETTSIGNVTKTPDSQIIIYTAGNKIRKLDAGSGEILTLYEETGGFFFDDRGPGHDGTITSDRTQAVATEVAVKESTMIPFVGLADRRGNLVKRIDMPYYCNHYHGNPDNTMLVGDDVDDLVIIDISGERAELQVLCNHKTSWHTQTSHCHPTWSWDGRRILYASDVGGRVNLYLVEP